VNRQYLINREAIRDVAQDAGRKLLINLVVPFEEKITVSRLKVNHFLGWLEGG
jgi:DNA-binding LytR/AlgR family response regulator